MLKNIPSFVLWVYHYSTRFINKGFIIYKNSILVCHQRTNINCTSNPISPIYYIMHNVDRNALNITICKTYTAWKVSKVISGLYFPVFGLNTEIYSANLRIQCKCRKIRTRNSSIFGNVLCSDYIIMEITRISSMLPKHCIKFARIQVFTDLYSPRCCLYTGKYGSVKTRILAYFMYRKSLFIGKN